MKEILYRTSEAVASLNHIEGFNPMGLARKIIKEGQGGQEEQLYLDVKYRKLWFRLAHPIGKVISRIVSLTETMAIVEARVYLDKCDPEDNYIANSFSQKFRSDDPQFGDKFLELAETAAIGRALADAGFGLQFADVGENDDPAQVDAGIPVANLHGGARQNMQQAAPIPSQEAMAHLPQQAVPAQATAQQTPQAMQQQDYPPQPMQQQGYPPQPSMMDQFYQQAQASGAMMGQAAMQTNMQALDASAPIEELERTMSYEQATQVVITGTGKYGGKTMGQVAIENPKNLEWFAYQYTGKNNLIPAAARVILAKAMPMAS